MFLLLVDFPLLSPVLPSVLAPLKQSFSPRHLDLINWGQQIINSNWHFIALRFSEKKPQDVAVDAVEAPVRLEHRHTFRAAVQPSRQTEHAAVRADV